MIFRSTDIETLADYDRWTQGEPAYKLVGDRQRANKMHVRAEVRGSTGELLGMSGRVVYPASVEETDPVPPPYACRVVSVSFVDVVFDPTSEPKYRFDKCYTECLWDVTGSQARADALEHKILTAFNAAMEVPDVHLVTWNGRTFDLPVLMMRSLLHRLVCSWYYKNRDMRYRYSTEGHCDLMDFLSDYGAARFMKLGDMARLIGLPGKTDMSGDKVAELYAASCKDPALAEAYMAKTARYCLQDSLQTALLWLRTRHFLGKVLPETHNAALASFRESKTVTDAIELDWERLVL